MRKKKDTAPKADVYMKKRINLLPEVHFKKKRRRRIGFLAVLLAVALVGAVATYFYDLHRELAQVQKENVFVKKELEIRTEERNRQALLQVLKERVEKKVNLLKKIDFTNSSVTAISKVIQSSLPKGVVYISVDFDAQEGITINGRTENKEEIPDLLHRVRRLNLFSKVEVQSINRIEQMVKNKNTIFYDFALACEIGGEGNASDES